jgi:hypothetical protein
MLRIWIDLDDVLAQTYNYILSSEILWVKLNLEDLKDFNYYKFIPWLDRERWLEIYINKLLDDEKNLVIKPMPWAIEKVKLFKQMWYELQVITWRHKTLKNHTYNWIDKYFPDLFSKIHITQSYIPWEKTKWEVCKEENIDIIIDDIPHFIGGTIDEKLKIYLFNRPWNEDYISSNKNLTRFDSWKNIVI